MVRSRFACSATLAGVLTLACESSEPGYSSVAPPRMEAELVHQSAQVRVFIEPGLPFCGGDGARMDAHVERLASKLGVVPRNVPVYVVADDQGEAIADWCFGSFSTLAGCFQPWVVMSKAWAVPHELNHVVLETLNSNHDVRGSSLFWFEGYASAWETHATSPRMNGLHEQSIWAAYRTADHLIRWLEDIRGSEAVRDFYAMLERDWEAADVEAAFVEMFGMSYEQALARYELEAPPIYPGYGWCDEAKVIEVPLGVTRAKLRFDCDAVDTHALGARPIEGMYLRRVLRLGRTSDLRLEFSRKVGVQRRHPCLETPLAGAEDRRLADEVWFEAGGEESSSGLLSTMNGVPAGDNLVEIVVPLGDPVEVELKILAKPASL